MTIRLRLALAAVLLIVLGGSRIGAQQADLKDPEVAHSYSFYVPGGGHFYTGEYLRGGAMLGVSVYAGLQVVKTATCGSTNKSDYTYSGNCPAGGALLWLGVMAVPYIYGIIDARASAERVNAKIRAQASRFSPFLDADPRGRLSLGLSVRTR
jgi:hypothetical protein